MADPGRPTKKEIRERLKMLKKMQKASTGRQRIHRTKWISLIKRGYIPPVSDQENKERASAAHRG